MILGDDLYCGPATHAHKVTFGEMRQHAKCVFQSWTEIGNQFKYLSMAMGLGQRHRIR